MEVVKTEQEKFWSSDFGKEYSNRNSWESDEQWDKTYIETWSHTKLEINDSVLHNLPKEIKILEVGCNIGNQLRGFQRMGFNNLYGIELQSYAVEKAKEFTKNINIIQGSGFDLPFKDEYFDMVCTNGVLIHIAPKDHFNFMSEIVRCSKKYVMAWEYYADNVTEINYRGNAGFLWKADFAKIYTSSFKNLKLANRKKYPYKTEGMSGNVDEIFLLEKIK
jgi:pseudaminic acid biosynthesis-associated methylase